MKTIKIFLNVTALVITMLFWAFAVNAAGGSPAVGLGVGATLFAVAKTAAHFGYMPKSVAMAGIYAEVWTGELVKQFTYADQATWLDGITDYSRYADKNVIHLIDVGADPDVLVNNTTYPIAIQDLGDNDIAISLHKFQTKATRVTDDELQGITYDKIGLKKEQHGKAITEKKFDMAIHAFCPAGHTSATPVLVTTGADDGNGRKRLIPKDVINLKDAWDQAGVPLAGRRLVLCNDHVNDLLQADQKFEKQYYNYTSGKIANMFSFEIFEYLKNPYVNQSTKAKISFGATPTPGTHYRASVAFCTGEMFKAAGDTKAYASAAKDNPTTQENLLNFRHYFIALPKKNRAIGAIVSAAV